MTTKLNSIVAKNHTNAAGQMVEQLEARQLLSVSMQDGVVHVTGTEGRDEVCIFATSAGAEPMLTVEIWSGNQGLVGNFVLADVTGVTVEGLTGDDHLTIDRAYDAELTLPVTVLDADADVKDQRKIGEEDHAAAAVADDEQVGGVAGDQMAMMPASEPSEAVETAYPAADDLFGHHAVQDDATVWDA